MSKTLSVNEIQVILQEYLGKRKSSEVAEELYEIMRHRKQYGHNGKSFFHSIDGILYNVLDKEEVLECRSQLFAEDISTTEIQIIRGVETIPIEGSNNQVYQELLKHIPVNRKEKNFLENLKQAIRVGVKPFNVPVCDMSLDDNGNPCWVPGRRPKTGYSYYEIEGLAIKYGLDLGTTHQYILFVSSLINRLIADEWNEPVAWESMVTKSSNLAYYSGTHGIELTGSRKIVGKCDLGNVCKVLEEHSGGIISVAGGSSNYSTPIASIRDLNHPLDVTNYISVDTPLHSSVPWFVF